jgi:hypothetical protein
MLSGCTNKLDAYQGTKPEIDIKEYFNGDVKAWGIVQDWKGVVTTRFDIDMHGSWEGNKGKLEEDFTYYDGKKQQRTWYITKKEDGTYEGTASDVPDKAVGNHQGSAINWRYSLEVPVDGKTYVLNMDDWMWQMNDGVLINRTAMKKFGLTVAELTIFMQKQGK